MTVKTSKDGTVTNAEGVVIGRVQKRTLNAGLYETDQGVSFTSGKAQWFAFNAAGQQLNTHGDDTRKRSVLRVEKDAEPLTVTNMKAGRGPMGSPMVSAEVRWAGNYCAVSRYPSERAWIVDCIILAGTFFPVFSNGTGTRYTESRCLQGEQAAAADAECVRLELNIELGIGLDDL